MISEHTRDLRWIVNRVTAGSALSIGARAYHNHNWILHQKSYRIHIKSLQILINFEKSQFSTLFYHIVNLSLKFWTLQNQIPHHNLQANLYARSNLCTTKQFLSYSQIFYPFQIYDNRICFFLILLKNFEPAVNCQPSYRGTPRITEDARWNHTFHLHKTLIINSKAF